MTETRKHFEEADDLSDIQLVQMAQQGSREAFGTLYDRYLPMVYNRVRYVIPEQDVEDVTQEIFIAMLRSLKSFQHKAKFSTWLRTLTNRRVVDYYRKRKPSEEGEVDIDMSDTERVDPALSTEGYAVQLDDNIVLKDALANLPEQYRDIILLRYAEGLKFSEMATLNAQSLEATKSLYRRAMTALRDEMGANP